MAGHQRWLWGSLQCDLPHLPSSLFFTPLLNVLTTCTQWLPQHWEKAKRAPGFNSRLTFPQAFTEPTALSGWKP